MSDTLNKTYFIDLDGTILEFQCQELLDEAIKNPDGYKNEKLLPNAREFLDGIGNDDVVVITTARTTEYVGHTLKALDYLGVYYDEIIFQCTSGPRIVVNDTKDSGIVGNKMELDTAYGLNVKRNSGDFSELKRINKQINKQMVGCVWTRLKGLFKR